MRNVRALTFLRQIAATAAPGVTAYTDENRFPGKHLVGRQGRLPGQWTVGNRIIPKSQTGTSAVAALPLPPGGRAADVVVGNQLFGVTTRSPHQQAALDFVRLLATARVARINYLTTGRLPANRAVLDTIVARASGPMAVFVDSLKAPAILPLPSYVSNPQKIWDEWYNTQLAALATSQPISDLLAKAQTNAAALLQQ